MLYVTSENLQCRKDVDVVIMEGIVNAGILIKIYGYWPTFHDATVLRLFLDRGGVTGPEMTVHICLWEPNPKLDMRVLVTLIFRGIKSFILSGFSRENMLDGIEVVPLPQPQQDNCSFSVSFHPISGPGFPPEMEFRCREIEVSNVSPCKEDE